MLVGKRQSRMSGYVPISLQYLYFVPSIHIHCVIFHLNLFYVYKNNVWCNGVYINTASCGTRYNNVYLCNVYTKKLCITVFVPRSTLLLLILGKYFMSFSEFSLKNQCLISANELGIVFSIQFVS